MTPLRQRAEQARQQCRWLTVGGHARISLRQLRRLLCRSSAKTLNVAPCWPAGRSDPIQENEGWCFYCPDCKTRNALKDIGAPGGAVELVQPERSDSRTKSIATARPRGRKYAAQLRVQRALGMKGTYAVEERWEQLGVFLDAHEAVAHAKSIAADLLDRKASLAPASSRALRLRRSLVTSSRA